VLATHLAEIRIVQNQIAEFRALLHEVHLRKTLHFIVKAVKADQFAENGSRVVETKRLVKVTGQ